jgi:hypothetical protein
MPNWTKAALNRVRLVFLPYDCILERSKEYREAEDWAKRFQPAEGFPVGPIETYAERRYKDVNVAFTELDQKLDAMIRYVAAEVALIGVVGTIAVRGNVGTDRGTAVPAIWLAAVALGVALLTMLVAVVARCPGKIPTPADAREFLQLAIEFPAVTRQQLSALIAASQYCAAAGLGLLVAEKARRLAWATWMSAGSLILLVAWVVAVIAARP